jgi:hypothetical protein
MKKKIIVIGVSVSLISFFLIIIFSAVLYFQKLKLIKENDMLKKDNDDLIAVNQNLIDSYIEEKKITDKEIEKYKKESKHWKKEALAKIPCEDKDDIIIALQKDKDRILELYEMLSLDFDSITKRLNITNNQLIKTTEQLNKTNEMLKKINHPFGVGIYVMGGVTGFKKYLENQQMIEPELIVGIDAIFNFLNNRVSLKVGPYAKVYQDVGIGGKLGIDIMFGKNK